RPPCNGGRSPFRPASSAAPARCWALSRSASSKARRRNVHAASDPQRNLPLRTRCLASRAPAASTAATLAVCFATTIIFGTTIIFLLEGTLQSRLKDDLAFNGAVGLLGECPLRFGQRIHG